MLGEHGLPERVAKRLDRCDQHAAAHQNRAVSRTSRPRALHAGLWNFASRVSLGWTPATLLRATAVHEAVHCLSRDGALTRARRRGRWAHRT